MEALFADGIFVCSTVRPNPKGLPKWLRKEEAMERGSLKYAEDNIAATKWMDKKAVAMLSTAHNSTDGFVVTVRRRIR